MIENPSRSTGAMPTATAPSVPPGTRNGRRNSGSRMRSATSAINSSERLPPYKRMSSVTSRSKPSPRHSAHPIAQTTMATQGARVRVELAKSTRQHAVLGHGQGQARITHHQSIEYPETTHHAAEHQRGTEQRTSNQTGNLRPGTRLPRAGPQAGQPHRRDGQNVAHRDDR